MKAIYFLPARKFRSEQQRHFIISVVIPATIALGGPAILAEGWFSWKGVGIGLFMWWLVGCLGVSVGFHRQFAHRSFTTPIWLRYILGGFGQMAMQGSVIYWTSLHRCHHSLSDLPGDPHSPSIAARPGKNSFSAFIIGHIGWTLAHDVPKPTRYAVDLMADASAQRLSKQYWAWAALGWTVPSVFGAILLTTASTSTLQAAMIGAWWGGALRLVVGHQIIWSINSLCHRFGSRPHTTSDSSTNNAWLAIPSWGESWHNNHHHKPTSARLGSAWWQIDVGWWCIMGLRWVGLASLVR